MKKHRRPKPTLFDRFCDKYGASIMKVFYFFDKKTHGFFEVLACIVTGGYYQPQPYQEPKEILKDNLSPFYKKRPSVSDSLVGDFRSVMKDMYSVSRDVSKAVRRMEHDDSKVARVIQEVKKSPEFQKQAQEVSEKIADIQRRCHQVRHICTHQETIGSGNMSAQKERN